MLAIYKIHKVKKMKEKLSLLSFTTGTVVLPCVNESSLVNLLLMQSCILPESLLTLTHPILDKSNFQTKFKINCNY